MHPITWKSKVMKRVKISLLEEDYDNSDIVGKRIKIKMYHTALMSKLMMRLNKPAHGKRSWITMTSTWKRIIMHPSTWKIKVKKRTKKF